MLTGVNGFVGYHLTKALKASGFSVIGTGMQPNSSARVKPLLDDYYSVDLSQASQVKSLPLRQISNIINLAGLAKVGDSFTNPQLYMHVNTAVVRNISDFVLANKLGNIRHLAISTGAVYDPDQKLPLAEDGALADKASPYVLSKIAMEKLCRDYIKAGLDMVIVRPFNHIGPGQETGFILPDLIAEARRAMAGDGKLYVGNLKTRRDYTDVRDVAKAYVKLVSAPSLKYRLYNVCRGQSITGQQLLDLVLSFLAPAKEVKVIVDKSKFRSSDAMNLYGSNARLKQETSWQPVIGLAKTIKDTLAENSS